MELYGILVIILIISGFAYWIFWMVKGDLKGLKRKKKISIEEEVVLIRKRLGWIIFWLIMIMLSINELINSL